MKQHMTESSGGWWRNGKPSNVGTSRNTDWSGVKIVCGLILLILGAIIAIYWYFTLAFADAEFAKHDDSLWALFQMIGHAWYGYALIGLGALLMWFGFMEG